MPTRLGYRLAIVTASSVALSLLSIGCGEPCGTCKQRSQFWEACHDYWEEEYRVTYSCFDPDDVTSGWFTSDGQATEAYFEAWDELGFDCTTAKEYKASCEALSKLSRQEMDKEVLEEGAQACEDDGVKEIVKSEDCEAYAQLYY